ncbi:hypothetical protein KJ059_04325 [Myxococcota bacterium]|nr:hypothetical protein [Myxococcota bacterium]
MEELAIRAPIRTGIVRCALAGFCCVLLLPGCAWLGVRAQREALQRFARVRGEVRVDVPSEQPIIVVLLRRSEPENALDPETREPTYRIIDHFPLAGAGRFGFAVTPGSFRLAAFVDENRNRSYDPGEPALSPQPPFRLGPGETLDDVELVIPHDAALAEHYDILALEARAPRDPRNFSLGRFSVAGDVVDLADPRLGPASGRLGLWRFVDFLFEVGPGVYFLDEYDADRIPVLFVHGMGGYPQEFANLIAALDRDRFQPWVYFYPSGVRLESIVQHLTDTIAELHLRHGFASMAVVAHSMGGLVSRAFIHQLGTRAANLDVPLFVSLSTPWAGSESAANVERAPESIVVFSWLDMRPGSEFLEQLFYHPGEPARRHALSSPTQFHLLFGFRRDERSFGPSSDGVISVQSQARREAVQEARTVLPLDVDHAGILRSEEAAEALRSLLLQRFEKRLWHAR